MMYDNGNMTRFADNTILRWTTKDPLCEKYYNTSPYVFCLNNPLRYEDPDGKVVKPSHQTVNMVDCNVKLREMIIRSKQETIKNMQE